jgi:hypothetical protein
MTLSYVLYWRNELDDNYVGWDKCPNRDKANRKEKKCLW